MTAVTVNRNALPQPPLLGPNAACKLAGISHSTGYRWLNAGCFPGAVRLAGGRWMIRRAMLERWLAGEDEPIGDAAGAR